MICQLSLCLMILMPAILRLLLLRDEYASDIGERADFKYAPLILLLRAPMPLRRCRQRRCVSITLCVKSARRERARHESNIVVIERASRAAPRRVLRSDDVCRHVMRECAPLYARYAMLLLLPRHLLPPPLRVRFTPARCRYDLSHAR